MLAPISQFLAVDSSKFPLNEHIIIGDRSCQGGFLIHYFLNLCQKQKRPILFIGLTQSFSHYNTVGQKLGNNLVSARDENKSLIFIDGLQLLSQCVGTSYSQEYDSNPFLHILRGNSTNLLELIRSSLETLAQTETAQVNGNAPVVIIDDLSILYDAGAPAESLLLLVNGILELVTSTDSKGSLVILFHLDKEDEKAQEIYAFLTHLSTLQIEVSDLQSGYCRDVHGQVKTQWRDSHVKPQVSVGKHVQFKLSDKSIDLFAPGMSAAVL